MDVKLVIEQGKTRTKALHLRKEEGLVGRVKGCDFRIPSPEVSRRHCVLRVRDGYVTVEDLKSSNGTHLNGELVEGEQVVRPGDRLRIGPITFIVEYQLTPEAIDRLLRGEDVPGRGEPEFEILEEAGAEPTAEDDLAPVPVDEEPEQAVDELEVIDAGEYQLPETEELRDILTSLDEDEDSSAKKGKKKR
jgi:pSer/pThr/pTyr-binding forkhead associated (FHA) protein